MHIEEVKQHYQKSLLSKPHFIDQMYQSFHQILFEYAKNLKNTEISKIEIEEDGIIMSSRPTNYHVGNVKIYCEELNQRTIPLEAFNFDFYEKDYAAMIYQWIRPDDVVFDIGANIGWYTNHIAATYPQAKVYAFEPIPKTFEKLKKNIMLNNLHNTHAYQIALSEKKQLLKFYYSPKYTGSSSSRNILENTEITEMVCPSMSLDDFVKENHIDKLDFIKCDVEGGELSVYLGAKKSIEKFKPIICTEMLRKWAAKFEYHPNDIISFFSQLNYFCFFIEKRKIIEIKKINDETLTTNFFFLHKEIHRPLFDFAQIS